MTAAVVYLMRGLPSSGKSFTARQLAGDAGIVLETDEFFYTEVGSDPTKYDYQARLLDRARSWNFKRFKRALNTLRSPLVVDRGNGMSHETRRYIRRALKHGYQVELAEPSSEWWQEIRVLLKYKEHVWPILRRWAKRLAKMQRETHRCPADVILRRMRKWQHDLTVEAILAGRRH